VTRRYSPPVAHCGSGRRRTALAAWVILRIAGAITPLRVNEEDELEGLDLTRHEERGYSR